jgi:hypothetical protein
MTVKVNIVAAIGRDGVGAAATTPQVEAIAAKFGGRLVGGLGSSTDPIVLEFANAQSAAQAAQAAFHLDSVEDVRVSGVDGPGGMTGTTVAEDVNEALAAVAAGEEVGSTVDALVEARKKKHHKKGGKKTDRDDDSDAEDKKKGGKTGADKDDMNENAGAGDHTQYLDLAHPHLAGVISGVGGDGHKAFHAAGGSVTRPQAYELAQKHHAKAAEAEAAWGEHADKAAQAAFGRKFEFGDYRVAGVGREEFSDEHKGALRTLARTKSAHRVVAGMFDHIAHPRGGSGPV